MAATSITEEYSKSGLSQTLHGITYQIKYLLYTLIQCSRELDHFKLASEMDVAEKHDDVIIIYQNSTGQTVRKFVQIKYKTDESSKITGKDLVTESACREFSLLKYFLSFLRVKKNFAFRDSEINEFIISTNADFDFDSLKNCKIYTSYLGSNSDTSKSYRLKIDGNHKLVDRFKFNSDLNRLVRDLVDVIKNDKDLSLSNDLVVRYHVVLAKYVLQLADKNENLLSFRDAFLEESKYLPEEVSNFRRIFLSQNHLKDEDFTTIFKDKKIRVSKDFSLYFVDLEKDPKIGDEYLDEFVKIIADYIDESLRKKQVVRIRKDKSKKGIVKMYIDLLSGHVFVKVDKYFKFRTGFFKQTIDLPGNLNCFRSKLKVLLDCKEIDKVTFEINNFPTFLEESIGLDLPGEVTDEDIKDFFDNSSWEVNKPSEDKLDEEINEAVQIESKDIDREILENILFRRISDWIKSKRGTFLTKEDLKCFFKEIQNKISQIVFTIGISGSYIKKLKKLNIEFDSLPRELKDFLKDSDRRILGVRSSSVTLATICLEQAVRADDNAFKEVNRYVFIESKTFLLYKNDLIDVFSSKEGRFTLLVIVCDSGDKIPVQEIARVVKLSNSTKKLILVSKTLVKDVEPSDIINLDFKCNILDLKTETRKRLFKKNVMLQGKELILEDVFLIFEDPCKSLQEDDIRELKELFQNEILLKLFSEENLKLSNELNDLGEINRYYINRKLVTKELVKQVFTSPHNYLFIFIESDLKKFKQFLPKDDVVLSCKDFVSELSENVRFVTVSSLKEAEKLLSRLDRDYLNRDIHLLKLIPDKDGINCKIFVETSYRGSLDKFVLRYEETTPLRTVTKEKLVLISNVAGMGKTTLLKRFCNTYKEQNPNFWVLQVDLNDCSSLFYDQHQKRTIDNTKTAVSFLIDYVLKSKIKNNIEKVFLNYACHVKGNVLLALDGFDEICPLYKDFLIDWIKYLMLSKIETILITSRPNSTKDLCNNLQPFELTLEKFSFNDQLNFLTKFWCDTLQLDEEVQTNVEQYAACVIKSLRVSIHDKELEFFGIPLQTMLVAEIMKDSSIWEENDWSGCVQYVSKKISIDTSKPHLPNMDLNFLYSRFVKIKFDIFIKEKIKAVRCAALDSYEKDFKTFIREHEKLALYTLLLPEHFDLLYPRDTEVPELLKSVEEFKEKRGLVVDTINNYPRFIHRTFAEYFAGNALAKLEKPNGKVISFLHKQILQRDNFVVTRSFLDTALDTLEEKRLSIKRQIISKMNKNDSKERTQFPVGISMSIIGKVKNHMSLYSAIKEGHCNIFRYLMSKVRSNSEARKMLKYIFKTHPSCITDILTGNHLNVLKLISKLRKNQNDLLYIDIYKLNCYRWEDYETIQWIFKPFKKDGWGGDITIKYGFESSPLHHAAMKSQLKTVQWIVTSVETDQRQSLVSARDTRGRMPIHYAAQEGRTDIVRWLCETIKNNDGGFDLNVKDKQGITPLHLAAENGKEDTIKWICGKLGGNVNPDVKDDYARTAMHLAAKYGEYETVKLLGTPIDKGGLGGNVNAKDKEGRTPVHYAATKVDMKDSWPQDSLTNRSKEIIEIDTITEEVSDVDVTSWLFKKLTIEWLCTSEDKNGGGCDVNIRDTKGETPTHLAARCGNREILRWLCTPVKNGGGGADLNIRNKNDLTPIEMALISGKTETFQWMGTPLDQSGGGSDINIKDSLGRSLLHKAAQEGQLDIVKWLCKPGRQGGNFDVNIKDPRNITAVFYAVMWKYFEIVKWLVTPVSKNGAGVNSKEKDENGMTLLHFTAREGRDLRMIEWLSRAEEFDGGGSNLNDKDNKGYAAIHYAVVGGHLPTVEWLCKSVEEDGGGIDPTDKDFEGRTPLDIAEQLEPDEYDEDFGIDRQGVVEFLKQFL